jgi:hypothetical protein
LAASEVDAELLQQAPHVPIQPLVVRTQEMILGFELLDRATLAPGRSESRIEHALAVLQFARLAPCVKGVDLASRQFGPGIRLALGAVSIAEELQR